jgi:hypothetical protein
MFRDIPLQGFLTQHGDSEKAPEFSCSAGFSNDFKRMNRMSSRSAHYKRHQTVDPTQEQEWITLMKDLAFPSSQRERVLNCDETTWSVYRTGVKTRAETGTQNVQTDIEGNEKDSFTVRATIAAARTRFPLPRIVYGKTERCEVGQSGAMDDQEPL